MLERFRLRTSLFFTGDMCGTRPFPARPGRGFLHILRHGSMTVTHRADDGSLDTIALDRPTLLFYPRPWAHTFHNPPVDGSSLTCAALDFDGGATHPLLRALPPVMLIPLEDLTGFESVLALLFDEADELRCGHRLVADRLFEVILIRLLRWILDHSAELEIPAGLIAGLGDARLAPVLVAIHDNPEREWTLLAMAAEARMSRSVFAAHFKRVVGLAPGEYLTQWRLTIAQSMLLTGAPIARVAPSVGYDNASSFSRVFAQHLGQAPRDWVARELRPATRHEADEVLSDSGRRS